MTRTIYSVQIKNNDYATDLFNGTFDECVAYIERNGYTEEENDVRIAELLVDENDMFLECLDIITEW